MVFGFIGKIIDWNRDLNSVMGPKFGESRSRAYARRLRRMGVQEHNIKMHLKEAEDKGNIKKVIKEMHNLVKIEHREGKLIFHIMQKEDVVEYDIIKHLEECNALLLKNKAKADMQGNNAQRVQAMMKIMQGLAELQVGKLGYLEEGGHPWEGVTTIASWDMGTTENVILGEAWKQRGMITGFEKMMNAVYAHADRIASGNAKKKSFFGSSSEEELEKSLKRAESHFNDLTASIKMQFYCSLRLIGFIGDELKSDQNMVHHFADEGFPRDTAEKMMREYKIETEFIKKQESSEMSRLRIEMSEAARR
ncbi:hypothetical protein COV19_00500 [Candidatus Woesearchaeota archaeon CG10_big_fil_rev_8_21_14_0_10_44_13]|nr:MAG: hypothetical protein COV19_00500 [Candidatus Woesearchaeota archaeon CG10_big_fil_rev_8_21_14_0_10_44_13]